MEIKPAGIDNFIKSPTAGLRVILIYGPDRGLVAERTRALVKHFAGSLDDAFNISRMNGSDVTSDDSPLFDEYFSIPMFGGNKTLWLFDDGTQIQKPIKNLLDEKQDGNVVLIEGRDLKKTSALVKLCIKHKLAVSLPCYQDNMRDVSQLIQQILAADKLKISPDNLQYLQSLLGNDRALSRSEINKLALYCLKQDKVTFDDITQCLTGDAAKFSFDKLLDAVASGQAKAADHELSHFLATGSHPVMILAIIRNHFNMLHLAAAGMAAGKSADNMVQNMRPPVFFNRKNAIVSQVNRWNLRKTDMAQNLIAEADISARMTAALSKDILNRLVTRLSLMAGR
ncbi:MAG: DNA polymerase III subunit delta [Rhizobiales bacterium]|nr:DNA polymerase III subunit delta [Hyphomicrobiales bacterium]NRB15187.1 DNA polymerase III subunit delta [Hyphomicrobiales bacterium]